MIIPLGHEQQTVRRLPWVTFVIIAVNVVAFLTLGTTAKDADRRIVVTGQEVMAYWQSHPYLELPESFITATVPDHQRERFDTISAAMKTVPPPEDPAQRQREQAWLEQLVDRFHAATRSHPYLRWGLQPAQLDFLALFTCMFMHAGWLHLLGNMFIFYLAAPAVEDAYGRPLFAGLYLVGGALASAIYALAFRHSTVVLVGASGAIAVIMGAFLVRFARTRIRFFYWFAWIFRGTFSAPAYVMLPLWLLEQLWLGGLHGEGSGVAYWAHVAGFGIGVAAAWGIRRGRVEERFIHPRIEARITLVHAPELDEGMRLLAERDPVGARRAFELALARDARNPDANLGMWESFVQEENAAGAGPYLARVIEHELRTGERMMAFDHWRELNAYGAKAPATVRWRLASELSDGHSDLATDVLEDLAADEGAGLLAAKAAGRLAELAGGGAERAEWLDRANRLEQAAKGVGAVGAGVADATRAAAGAAATAPAVGSTQVGPRPAAPPAANGEEPVPADSGVPEPAGVFETFDPGVVGDDAGAPVSVFETSGRPGAPPDEPRELRRVDRCALRGLHDLGLVVAGEGADEVVPFTQISAVAVGAVAEGERPYLVTDLVLRPGVDGVRRVLRFLSSELDPRALLGRPDLSPLEAFRSLLKLVVLEARARVLPGASVLHDAQFTTFASIAEYERQVLGA